MTKLEMQAAATGGCSANGLGDWPGASQAGKSPASKWKQTVLGRSVWVSPKEVKELIRRFPEVVELLEEEVRVESKIWAASAVVARSLGQRVAVEAVVLDFRLRAGLKKVVNGFNLDHGHLLFKFLEAEEWDRVLGWPWVVAGQALVVKPWRPQFHPAEGALRSTLAWVRLPGLSVELWGEASVQCLGFARACIRLDLGLLLRPGVVINGPEVVRL